MEPIVFIKIPEIQKLDGGMTRIVETLIQVSKISRIQVAQSYCIIWQAGVPRTETPLKFSELEKILNSATTLVSESENQTDDVTEDSGFISSGPAVSVEKMEYLDGAKSVEDIAPAKWVKNFKP